MKEFQAQHGASVTKWDIFYYVYGVLHDPTYRTRFADNLKKDLPRIPILPNFTAYRDAGKRLATLHLDYEKQPRFRDLRWERRNDASGKPVALDYRVQKMKAISTEKHPDGYAIISAIQVNPTLTITNIPPEASAYRLGNRSALEWIIDQYQVKTDKRSGITERPEHLQRRRTLHHRASRARRDGQRGDGQGGGRFSRGVARCKQGLPSLLFADSRFSGGA
ncbi:MAG UNVERIFIED_CONTAM: hypothetical protein LVT10_25975 [Anaerolineae bacterium]